MIKAKYTIVLKTLMDDENIKPLIDKALSTYPMYKPTNESLYSIIPTREELNNKLLNHYKYREIGFETIGRFLDELKISMEEIMPYYYQLFKSADVVNGIDDIFGNVDIVETFDEARTGKSNNDSTDNSTVNSNANTTSNATDSTTTTEDMTTNGKTVKSDTPQGQLSITNLEIDSLTYASEVGWNKNDSNSKGTSNGESNTNSETNSDTTSKNDSKSNSSSEGTTKHTLTKKGNQGVNTYAHDMLEFRELILNIEQQIINDKRIAELFMLVY